MVLFINKYFIRLLFIQCSCNLALFSRCSMCTAAQFGCAFSFSPSVCVSQHELSHYSSVMSCVVHHRVSQEWPWIAPDNITAGWHGFLCLWLGDDLVHLQKITDDPSPAKIGDKGPKKGIWGKDKRWCVNGRQRDICFLKSNIATGRWGMRTEGGQSEKRTILSSYVGECPGYKQTGL